jgi:hypothetical protein
LPAEEFVERVAESGLLTLEFLQQMVIDAGEA